MTEVQIGINSFGKIILIIAGVSLALVIPIIWFEAAPTLILLPAAIYLLLVSGWVYSRMKAASLEGVEVWREFPRTVEDGEYIDVELHIRNNGWLGHYPLKIVDSYPASTHLVECENRVDIYLPPKSEVVVSYRLRVDGIGKHVFGPLYMRTSDVIGVYTIERIDLSVEEGAITCIPRPSRGVVEYSESSRRFLIGIKTVSDRGYSMEFKEIREYIPGDDTRHIDWKATARMNKLMIRENYRETESDIAIVINVGRNVLAGKLGRRRYDYIARVAFELILTQINSYNRVGLVITGVHNAIHPLTRVTPETLPRFAETLASVPIYPSLTASIGYTPTQLLTGLGVRGKTLYIFITDLIDEEEVSYIVNLRSLGHNVYVINPVQILFDIDELGDVEKLLYLASTVEAEERRRSNIARLMANGVAVVEAGPETLLNYILDRLEEFRRLTPT